MDMQKAMNWLSALDVHSEYEATNKELILSYIENSIPTEVIEEKIEELDIAILECEYSDDDVEEYKEDVEKNKRRLLIRKSVL